MLSQHSTLLDLCKGPLFANMSIPLRSTDKEVFSCTDHQEQEPAARGAWNPVLLGGKPKLSPGNCSADAQRIPDKPARRRPLTQSACPSSLCLSASLSRLWKRNTSPTIPGYGLSGAGAMLPS